jgi:hypothetical protein
MSFLFLLLIKEAFADSIRKELEKPDAKQHPLITTAGLVAVELL